MTNKQLKSTKSSPAREKVKRQEQFDQRINKIKSRIDYLSILLKKLKV